MKKELGDDYIEEHYIGKSPIHNGPIYLQEYQAIWPTLFKREKQRIQEALNSEAIMIEHIGSTSIKGLCAKPIIDILLVVHDAGKEDSYVPALSKKGYVLKIKEPEFENHHMFKGPDTNINLHVFSQGSKEIDKYLLFRDYLNTHFEAQRSMQKQNKN